MNLFSFIVGIRLYIWHMTSWTCERKYYKFLSHLSLFIFSRWVYELSYLHLSITILRHFRKFSDANRQRQLILIEDIDLSLLIFMSCN